MPSRPGFRRYRRWPVRGLSDSNVCAWTSPDCDKHTSPGRSPSLRQIGVGRPDLRKRNDSIPGQRRRRLCEWAAVAGTDDRSCSNESRQAVSRNCHHRPAAASSVMASVQFRDDACARLSRGFALDVWNISSVERVGSGLRFRRVQHPLGMPAGVAGDPKRRRSHQHSPRRLGSTDRRRDGSFVQHSSHSSSRASCAAEVPQHSSSKFSRKPGARKQR